MSLCVAFAGFTSDQIRITYVNYTGKVNVSGERPLDSRNYRWSRFNESYSVPPDCEVSKIQAKFADEILTITMPKKSISQESQAQKTQEKSPSLSMKEESKKARHDPQKYEEQASSERRMEAQKKPTDEKGLKGLFPQEPIREPGPQKGEYEVESKPTLIIAPRRPIIEKPERGPFETQQEPTLKIAPRKPIDDGKSDSEKRKSEKMFIEKEIRTRKEAPKPPEKEKEKEIFSKEDIIGTIGKGIKQVSASATQVVTKISERKWNEEDKSVLVNMGAAVIVIAAIGAYWSYRFGSSDKT